MAIPSSETISFDHTFKVAANIGFHREDGKYDSLYIVMNGKGQILTWQLTKRTAFSQVETLLKDLKERSQMIRTVYMYNIDDCCKLRGKISSVFGSDVTVKLDLFHAVQRITNTLPKKNLLTKERIKLVFRKDGDSGDKRHLHQKLSIQVCG